jgi:hypothetical protein
MCFGGSKKSAPAPAAAPASPVNPESQPANNDDAQRRAAITASNTISSTAPTGSTGAATLGGAAPATV